VCEYIFMSQSNKKKGVIAAGHPETAHAAAGVLRDGGNAFDAAIAAQFTAFVAEPILTSLGGGGFLLAETKDGKQTLYDFFVQTPVKKKKASNLQFEPISADFGEAEQEFHIGAGSIATPGMVKGLHTIHEDLCTMPMPRLAEYAVKLAKNGVKVNAFQSLVFEIIKPIYISSDQARRIYGDTAEGKIFKMPELAAFLEELANRSADFFYKGEAAQKISEICSEQGGHLTKEDLNSYRVHKREPHKFRYRNSHISINPPPSSGGILIAFALNLIENIDLKKVQFGSEAHLSLLALVQQLTHKARMDAFVNQPFDDPAKKLFEPEYLAMYKKEIAGRRASFRGTTQISIADSFGNMASLTSSNGEGSGVMIPEAGVMLNNMLGEEDLNPGGFNNWQEGERMTSMMAPVILKLPDGTRIALGSGGSNRIRTALMQVLINLIDFDMPPEEAVNSPRVHNENGLINIEAGFEDDAVSEVIKQYPDHKIWKEKNLFFGGAHLASHGPKGFSGAGDERRGGVSLIV